MSTVITVIKRSTELLIVCTCTLKVALGWGTYILLNESTIVPNPPCHGIYCMQDIIISSQKLTLSIPTLLNPGQTTETVAHTQRSSHMIM